TVALCDAGGPADPDRLACPRHPRSAHDREDVSAGRAVAEFLQDEGVTTGIAPYWVAYNLTFRTGGRVHVASSELVRIRAYQNEYDARRDRAVRIDLGPCDAGREVLVRGVKICMSTR